MKKTFFLYLVILCLTASSASAQDNALQAKFDSIIAEADLLYRYEKVAWIASDLFMETDIPKTNIGGYMVYHSNDTLFMFYYNKEVNKKLISYYFTNADLEKPFRIEKGPAELNKVENDLVDAKVTILGQLSEKKFNVGIPEGYSPNFDMIREKKGFRFYIIMGTSHSDEIPFGNDYIFRADTEGTITTWQKLHSRIIPTLSTGPDGEKIVSCIHSHLKTTPYITATDICTFRLYAPLVGLKEFMVLSTATGQYYKYNLDTNKITTTEP